MFMKRKCLLQSNAERDFLVLSKNDYCLFYAITNMRPFLGTVGSNGVGFFPYFYYCFIILFDDFMLLFLLFSESTQFLGSLACLKMMLTFKKRQLSWSHLRKKGSILIRVVRKMAKYYFKLDIHQLMALGTGNYA